MWWLYACFDESEGLRPSAPELPPERPELAPLKGRWSPVVAGSDGKWSLVAACPHTTPPFVEIKADGQDGWQLVTGSEDALQILQLGRVESGPQKLVLTVDGDPNGQPVELDWVEPDRIAKFPTLYADQPFVVPSAKASLPTAPARCP